MKSSICVKMASSEVSINRKIISEDLSNVEFDTSEDVEVIPTFDSMGLRDELLRGIYTYGMFISFSYTFTRLISEGVLTT